MNIPLIPLLAALRLDMPKSDRALGRLSSLLLSDVLLIVGAGLAVLLILAAFVYLWMKVRRRRRRHISGGQKVFRGSQRGSSDKSEDDLEEAEDEDEEVEEEAIGDHNHEHEHESGDHHHHSKRRYKYRVRRRGHRSRNPTLSETGGLPPVKPHEPIKP